MFHSPRSNLPVYQQLYARTRTSHQNIELNLKFSRQLLHRAQTLATVIKFTREINNARLEVTFSQSEETSARQKHLHSCTLSLGITLILSCASTLLLHFSLKKNQQTQVISRDTNNQFFYFSRKNHLQFSNQTFTFHRLFLEEVDVVLRHC